MKEKDITARQAALNTALRDNILKKIDTIRENIVFAKGSDKPSYFQMLIMVDEDLGDVLLNWEYDAINPNLSFGDDLDEDEDNY